MENGKWKMACCSGVFSCDFVDGSLCSKNTTIHKTIRNHTKMFLAHLRDLRKSAAEIGLTRQSVRVTFDSDRGASGFRPFASANNAANNCPGIMYGIGAKNSSISRGMIIARVHEAAVSKSLVIESVSACNSRNRSIRSLTPKSITPGGANRITGKWRSTIANGPCRKSADENLSATT